MSQERIRCAVVGLRQGLENVQILLDHPRFELVAVCDLNPTFYAWMVGDERIEDVQDEDAVLSGQTRFVPMIRDHPKVRSVGFYDNYDRLLAEADIEAVFVYVPDPFHAAMTVKALDAGKFVLLTKPLSSSIEDGRLIAASAREHPGHFMLGFQFCYSSFARKVLEIIASRKLGEVRHLYFEHHRAPLHPPHHLKNAEIDGPVLKEGCHWLDLLYHFAGRPRFLQVAGIGGLEVNLGKQEIDDNGLLLIEYENGVRAFHGYTYYRWKPGSKFAMIGDRGTLRGSFHELLMETDDGDEQIVIEGMGGHAGYAEMHDEFAAMVRDGRDPYSNSETALENLLLSMAAQTAIIENRTVRREEVDAGFTISREPAAVSRG